MKKIWIGIATAALMGTSAWAAPVAAPASFNWTGFYAGIVGGGGMFSNTFSDVECTFNCTGPNQSKLGGTVGLTAGANWQFGHGVIGVEADVNWADFNNKMTITPGGTTTFNQAEWKDFSTVRARTGLAVDNVFIYATGGLAIADTHFFNGYTVGGQGLQVSSNGTKVGLAAGGGAEYGITNNLSAKLEYLFINVSNAHADLIQAGGCANAGNCPVTWQSNAEVVRAGLNYRF